MQRSGRFTRNRRADALAEALAQDPGQGHDGPDNGNLEYDEIASIEIGRIDQDAGSVVDEPPENTIDGDPPDDTDAGEHPNDAVDGADEGPGDSVAPEGEQVLPAYAPGHGSAMSLVSSRHNSPLTAGASGAEGSSSERGEGYAQSLPPLPRTTPHLPLHYKSRRARKRVLLLERWCEPLW